MTDFMADHARPQVLPQQVERLDLRLQALERRVSELELARADLDKQVRDLGRQLATALNGEDTRKISQLGQASGSSVPPTSRELEAAIMKRYSTLSDEIQGRPFPIGMFDLLEDGQRYRSLLLSALACEDARTLVAHMVDAAKARGLTSKDSGGAGTR